MPPSTWMQSLVLACADSMPVAAATAAAMESCASASPAAAWAASAAATEICSERSSISAHMCLIAWKLPIGLPNCSRTFAYSTAVSSAHRANPAVSAASTVAARSSTRCGGVDSVVAGALSRTTRDSGREKSVAESGSTVTPSAAVSISSQPSGPGNSTTPPATAPSTYPATPDTRSSATRRSADRAKPAVRSPDINASSTAASSTTSVARALDATGPGISAAAASSTIAHRSVTDAPAPPASSATATPNSPSSASPT